MISYTPSKIDRQNGSITFLINNEKEVEVNILEQFPEYVLLTSPKIDKYYIDINSGSLIIIENYASLMKSMRGPTFGNINIGEKYYRPAILSDIDANEKQYNSDNWKLFNYLEKIYNAN